MPRTADKTRHWKRSMSKLAAEGGNATKLRDAILALMKKCARPMTADEIADLLGYGVISIRPRISDLVRDGILSDAGARGRTANNRTAIAWMLMDEAA